MLKWFWPAVTWTAALTSLALWFGAKRVETDIGLRTGQALSAYSWAGFDVDGRDVVLKGMAPDPETKQAAVAAVQQVRGIGDLSDLVSVLEAASPYVFKLTKSADGIVLSGFIPDNAMRESIMSAAEAAGASALVDDQMALARGAQADFEARVLFAIELSKKLNDAEIEFSDSALLVKGRASDNDALNALNATLNGSLPYGMTLSGSNISQP